MAEETLDAAVKSHELSAEACKTVGLVLEGGKGWTPTLYIRLVQDYGLENEVETHKQHAVKLLQYSNFSSTNTSSRSSRSGVIFRENKLKIVNLREKNVNILRLNW